VSGGSRRRCFRGAALTSALLVGAYLPAVGAAASATTSSSTTSTSSSTTTVPTSTTSPPAANGSSGPSALDPATILSAQKAVVTQDHQPAIQGAQLAATESATVASQAEVALVHDHVEAAAAASTEAADRRQLAVGRAALLAASGANQAAQARLAGDRARLRALALAVYTGALTSPEPQSLYSLETEQEAVIDRAEVGVVAGVVVRDLHVDTVTAAATARRDQAAIALVAGEQAALINATGVAAAAASLLPPAAAQLASDQRQLATKEEQLASTRAELTAALAALAGPASAGSGVSVLGTSALNAAQLTAWYNYEGFADLTSTTINRLAAWYIQAGAEEGVRGDVAFAQAVLETGGFSSPDAVELNNYAGIGHCDTCSAGWAFPSPRDGVVGQLQLLRIFADPGAAPGGAPAPVLPALNPADQSRSGCCQTWESLTGVWATDSSYAADILSIYEQMMDFALAPAASTLPTSN
jgi:Mannosyl-glycoprotein endo-beta-N-acetylglucosaminidase